MSHLSPFTSMITLCEFQAKWHKKKKKKTGKKDLSMCLRAGVSDLSMCLSLCVNNSVIQTIVLNHIRTLRNTWPCFFSGRMYFFFHCWLEIEVFVMKADKQHRLEIMRAGKKGVISFYVVAMKLKKYKKEKKIFLIKVWKLSTWINGK